MYQWKEDYLGMNRNQQYKPQLEVTGMNLPIPISLCIGVLIGRNRKLCINIQLEAIGTVVRESPRCGVSRELRSQAVALSDGHIRRDQNDHRYAVKRELKSTLPPQQAAAKPLASPPIFHYWNSGKIPAKVLKNNRPGCQLKKRRPKFFCIKIIKIKHFLTFK